MAGYVAIPSKETLSLQDHTEADFCSENEIVLAPTRRNYLRRIWPWLLHLAVFTISVSAGLFVTPRQQCPTTGGKRPVYLTINFGELTSYRADALIPNHPYDRKIRLNGTFNRDSPFKGPPSPEVDRAWDEILPRKLRKTAYRDSDSD